MCLQIAAVMVVREVFGCFSSCSCSELFHCQIAGILYAVKSVIKEKQQTDLSLWQNHT